MTWNIHGARDAGLEQLAREIAAHAPDIVCLNEVRRSDGARLGALLGMRASVASSRIGPYGNAILTVEAPASFRRHRFPGTRRRDRRDAAIVVAREITVAALHLNLRARKRRRDIASLLDVLPTRALVCGDLNERDGGAVAAALRTRFHDAGAASARPTFPATAPEARIDFVWVPPDARVEAVWVPATTSSDHRPVVVDVRLAPAATIRGARAEDIGPPRRRP